MAGYSDESSVSLISVFSPMSDGQSPKSNTMTLGKRHRYSHEYGGFLECKTTFYNRKFSNNIVKRNLKSKIGNGQESSLERHQ